MVFKDNKFEFVPAYKVNVVDTVGCEILLWLLFCIN